MKKQLQRGSPLKLIRSFVRVGILLVFGVAACQPDKPPSSPIPRPTTDGPLPSMSISPQETQAPSDIQEVVVPGLSPTSVMISGGADQVASDYDPHTGPSPAPDPLRFVFPTPAPAPVSAWRPPLYPTPWAPSPYDHFYFARPIAADEVNWPLWDYRYGGIFFENVVHTGIDIPVKIGTPVLAAGSGKVTWAGYGLYRGVNDPTDPFGLAVAILHDFGYEDQSLYTVYGHLDQVEVVKGQYVETGEQLGLSGETGHTTGPHLHFEVRVGKNDYFTTRNPELWLVPPQGWGVLVGKVLTTGGLWNAEQTVYVRSKLSGQLWQAKSYGSEAVNNDPYYGENLVMGDLPAGLYAISIPFLGFQYDTEIEIHPGLVSYFTFRGHKGFDTIMPSPPGADFTPDP